MRNDLIFPLIGVLMFAAAQPANSQDSPPAMNAREATWVLAGKIGLAASASIHDADPQAISNLMSESQQLAKSLDIELPALPTKNTDRAAYGASVLHYLLKDLAPATRALGKKHGEPAAALMELGLKSYILTTMYSPGDSLGLTIAGVIESRAQRAQLPGDVDDALIAAIRNQASYDVVKTELLTMHRNVRSLLHDLPPTKKTQSADGTASTTQRINNVLDAAGLSSPGRRTMQDFMKPKPISYEDNSGFLKPQMPKFMQPKSETE
ncbi:hypothetical protein [Aporhodopirellula aestuarii]|uniref:Uncharacterized protein n=1 Tax=Aporhodopirellula aestuarii TaxID=2950107 RepID=A0ABT0U6E6_9BACT|nr:hypothetical protein [Aporhodopirellula aestuarii]MCM2371963.1 hypothetical protein [Aporhodopirellula aestuarii]